MSFKKLLPEVKEALASIDILGVSEFGKELFSTIKSGSHVLALAPEKSGKTEAAIVACFNKVNKELEGAGGGTGYYGGWGLVVVYENSQMNWRDVTIFDGHAYVAGGITANYELPISGFNTVQSGDVNMKVGMIAGEGDRNISGDYFQIRNWQNTNWITLNHAGNSTNNFCNSSVFTGGNPRNPNLLNNTGMDISMFDILNPSNSVITNNQTSTTFRYGTTQDTYIIFCMAMAVDAYIPDVEALVSTESINGIPANTPGLTVEPGDIIQYTVDLKNLGTEAVEDIQLTVPYMTSFEPGSISTQLNGGSRCFYYLLYW